MRKSHSTANQRRHSTRKWLWHEVRNRRVTGEVISTWRTAAKFTRACAWSWKGKREDSDRFKRHLQKWERASREGRTFEKRMHSFKESVEKEQRSFRHASRMSSRSTRRERRACRVFGRGQRREDHFGEEDWDNREGTQRVEGEIPVFAEWVSLYFSWGTKCWQIQGADEIYSR